jgi:hypothetical protein
MATIYIPEAMNLFVGDAGPSNSKHLVISEITFPKLTEKTAEHHAGGSIGAIEIGGLGMNALELGFKLTGVDPQSAAQFGVNGASQMPYTILAAVRDKQAGQALAYQAIVWGRMVEIDPGSFKRGDIMQQTHMIKEVMRYQLTWNNSELFYYDFYTSTWRVNGQSQNSDVNSILQITGGS